MLAGENVASGPRTRVLALGLGAGRVALGGAFLAYPVASIRLLGVDSASATRTAWLARMAATRDMALGAAVLAGVAGRRGAVPALLATAVVDAGDAAIIAAAAAEHRVDRVRGYLAAGGAAVGAAAAVVAAADTHRRR